MVSKDPARMVSIKFERYYVGVLARAGRQGCGIATQAPGLWRYENTKIAEPDLIARDECQKRKRWSREAE